MRRKVGIKLQLLLAYGLLAVFPMLTITFYTYHNTERILLGQMEDQVNQQLDQDVKALDEAMGRLHVVSDILYADSTLYGYLTTDYTRNSIVDMFFYVSDRIPEMRALFPELQDLCFYTTNSTLPQDIKYFYYLDPEMEEEWMELTDGTSFRALRLTDGRVSFIRRMDMYSSGTFHLFLRMDVAQNTLTSLMSSSETSFAYLEGTDGEILLTLNVDAGEIGSRETGGEWMTVSGRTKYCGTLTRSENIKVLQNQVSASAGRVFLVFLAAAAVAVLVIYLFSSSFKGRVDRIITGAREIGGGNLSYRISAKGNDELGQIAQEFNELGERLDVLIEDSYKKEIARRNSELNLLQEQINPHFLYNALASISSLARQKQDMDSCQAASRLADFYRISLNQGNSQLSVREELRLLESYLDIQRLRFGDDIQVVYDLEESLMEHTVIKLILQPVVENAIHHGRSGGQEEILIQIRLFASEGKLLFVVSDDGVGIESKKLAALQERLNQGQEGIGLCNVNARIKLQYGKEYGVFLESQPQIGTTVRLELPLEPDRAALPAWQE